MSDQEDFRLSAAELQTKYGPEGIYDRGGDEGQHPTYDQWNWQQAVAQRATRFGYWDWVKEKIDGVYFQALYGYRRGHENSRENPA